MPVLTNAQQQAHFSHALADEDAARKQGPRCISQKHVNRIRHTRRTQRRVTGGPAGLGHAQTLRSEEHTYELQSLMRISYAVLCLNKKTILACHLCTATNITH